MTKICTVVMFVFLDFHTAVCKQSVSILMHRCSKLSLAFLTAINRKVTESDHILLQYTLPQLYIITLYCCHLTSVANVASSPVWASAMLLLLLDINNIIIENWMSSVVAQSGPEHLPCTSYRHTQSCSKADSC